MAKELLIDGKLMPAKEFLKSIGLSVHALIHSTGLLDQWIEVHKIAYHAGRSEYQGLKNLNRHSLGPELLIDNVHNYADWKEAIEKPETFTEEHYIALSVWCAYMCQRFDLDPYKAIVRHSDVSGKDVRPDFKIDPGAGFDMDKLKEMTKAEMLSI